MLHRPRNSLQTLLCCGLFLTGSATLASAADPTGDWMVADGVANIRVQDCHGAMWGAVSWEKKPGGKDFNNPDATKRERPTLGMPILLNMKKEPGKEEWKGEVYNAKDGKTYSSTISLSGPDTLEIKGCVLGFLCGGESWTRVSGPIAPTPVGTMAKKGGKPTKKTAGQKAAPANTAAADPVGDICLLPDIAGLAH